MADSTCTVAGCGKPVHNKANGWCEMHYYRHYRYGDVNGGGAQTQHRRLSVDDQFKSYVHAEPSGCHIWQGGLLKSGYGCFRSRPAHRWIWKRNFGAIQAGLLVRHKCDRPACVNIDHLELGTPADNNNDMVVRGRSLKGAKNAIAKLTDEDVRWIKAAIRDKSATQKDIAARFGVTPSVVCHIKKGRSWRHVA